MSSPSASTPRKRTSIGRSPSSAGSPSSKELARILSRVRQLELKGALSSADKTLIKSKLLDSNPNVGEKQEIVGAFSAWIDEDDGQLEISLKALLSSYAAPSNREPARASASKAPAAADPVSRQISTLSTLSTGSDLPLESQRRLVEAMMQTASATIDDQDTDLDEHVLDGRSPSPEITRLMRAGIHNKTVLFYAKEMESIAVKAQALSKDRLVLGKISWERFDTPDGWPHLFIENTHDLQFNDVMFLASFHSPLVVFEQLSTMYALARYGCRSLRVIVPFFPTGTMERIEVVGEVATAASLARMLSMVPHCAGGPAQLLFLDIHALQEQFYFNDDVIVLLKSCIRLLLKALSKLSLQGEKVVIVFPDDGAFKRFNKKFAAFETVICHKLRLQQDIRVVEIRDGLEFVPGAHCVIVDDLVKSGGTLIECADVLLKAGASKVSAYVTHGVFPNDSFTKFFHSQSPKIRFDTFWVTDSIPTVACKLNEPPFKVLSIAPLIPFLRQNFWDTEPQRYD